MKHWLVLTMLIALAAGSAQAAAGAAPKRHPGLVRIDAPRRDAITGQPTRIVIRTSSLTRTFRVRLNGRDVRRSFRRSTTDRNLWIGQLGRDQTRRGKNFLVATATGSGYEGSDLRRFLVSRESDAITAVRAPRRTSGAARVSIQVPKDTLRFSVHLNGHSVGRYFGPRHEGWRTASLSPSHFLRHGQNRLRVLVGTGRGLHQVKYRTIVVPRTRPLAAAGLDRYAGVQRRLRLDGRSSRSVRDGAELAYRWQIVSRPEGSRAQLRTDRSGRPFLVPDRNGRYRIALKVTERSNRAATASAPDVMTLKAQPTYPLQQIKAMVQPPGNSDPNCVDFSLGPATGGTLVGMPCAPVQMLVLDRETLAVTAKKTFQTASALNQEFINTAYNNHDLIAMQIHPANAQGPDWDPQVLNQAMARVGCNGQYPGLTGGYAIQTFVVPRSADQPPSFAECKQTGDANDHSVVLDAYVIENQSNLYGFTLADYVPFKTAYGDPAGQSEGTMSIAGRTHGDTPASHGWTDWSQGQPYFHLVVVAAGEPTRLNRENAYPATADGLTALAEDLTASHGAVWDAVFLQTVGQPRMTDPTGPQVMAWYEVGKALEALGGTTHTFNTNVSASSYSLLGGAAIANEGRLARWEVTPALMNGYTGKQQPAFLAGTLSRNDAGWFTPETLLDPNKQFNDLLFSIAYQPPTPWFEDDPSQPADKRNEYAAALAYIGGQLNLSDIRAAYYGAADSVTWSDKRTDVKALAYPKNKGLNEQVFNQVKVDLYDEFEWVDTVKTFFGDLADPFQQSTTHTYVDLSNISDDILVKQLKILEPEDVNTTPALLSVISDLLEVSEVPGVSQIGAALSVVGEIASLGGEFSGAPLEKAVTIKTDELAQNLLDDGTARMNNLIRLRNVVLADRGKLKSIASHDPTKEPDWNPGNTDTINDAVARIEASANKIAYGTLMPVVADLYQVEPGYYLHNTHNNQDLSDAGKWECVGDWNTHHKPFSNAPPSSQIKLRLGATPYKDITVLRADPPWRMYVGMPKPVHDEMGGADFYRTPYAGLDATLTDPLFKTVYAGGIGLFEPWFWSPTTVFSQNLIQAFDVPGENIYIKHRCWLWWS